MPTEAAAREAEMQLRVVTSHTPVMLALFGRDLTCKFVNHACADLLQKEPEKIIGHSLMDVLEPAALKLILPHIRRVLAGDRVEYEADIPYQHGRTRTMHVVYVPDTDAAGEVIGWVASITDITERRKIESELLRERRFLRQVIDATPSMIFVKDRSGRFLLGNEALARSCGTTVEKLIGKTDADFRRTAGQVTHFQEADHEVMSTLKTLHIPEEDITLSDGVIRCFSTGKAPLLNDDGSCDKILGVATDITEHREAQRRLENALAGLEQRVEERAAELTAANEKLVAQMQERLRLENALLDIAEQEQRRLGQDLHDGLCQSLSGLSLMGRSLMKTLDEQGLHELASQARRLADLLHQSAEEARDVARGLHPVVVDSEGLVSALHELAARTDGHVRCRLRCERAVPIADNATAQHLYRIAQEAVANALKHADARSITLSLRMRGHFLTLGVADDGCGMPEVLLKKHGMGIRLMQYRADVIGADFVIRRRKGRGTQIICAWHMPVEAFDPASKTGEREDALRR